MIWRGIDVDTFAQTQTMNKRRPGNQHLWYSADEPLRLEWWDYIEEIPLDLRFASFKRRLAKAMAK